MPDSISVVLPAYNEEDNIPKTVPAAVSVLEKLGIDYEVVVVDDGSRDRTADVTLELARDNPRIRLVQHGVNRGYGAALVTGFSSATKDWTFLTDSDNQFDLTDLDKFVPLMGETDIIIGYRAPRRDPFLRRVYGKGWTTLINLLFGYAARDVDCAFKLFKREVYESITLESRGATLSGEFLVKARRKGYRFKQVPVKHLPRTAGQQTGARIRVIVRAFRELVRMWWRLRKEK